MKKLMLVLLCLAFFVSSVSLAEDFTLHSGVKFGMTREEVTQAEADNGFTVYNSKAYKAFYDENGKLDDEEVDVLSVSGTIANRDHSCIFYYFDDNGLMWSAIYELGNAPTYDDYESIQSSLKRNYYDLWKNTKDRHKEIVANVNAWKWEGSELLNDEIYDSSFHIIEQSDGSVIFLGCALLYGSYGAKLIDVDDLVYTGKFTQLLVEYSYFDEATRNANIEAINGKKEREQQEQNQQDSDL